MSDTELPKGYNPLDKLSEKFIARYKYELLASFALLTLLGGIVLAVKVMDGRKAQVEVVPANQEVKAAQDQKLVVEISGEVNKPGVYKLEAQSRVDDLVKAAQDFTSEADMEWVAKNLNRAEVLSDGQKVYIPAKGEAQSQTDSSLSHDAEAAVTSKINLNTASQAQLESLPGIGSAYAQRIIAARPFKTVGQLLNVSGIGSKKYVQLKDLVSVY